jgi:macrolide transport system ATP-binding/permease protein
MLTINNLRIQYGERLIISNANLTFQKGKVYVISGESGSGKSSLLNILGLIQKANVECEIRYDEIDLLNLTENNKADFIRNTIGFVFQQNNLISSLSVYDNLSIQLRNSGIDEDAISKVVEGLIEYVGLTDVSNSYPSDISGGEEQRVAIARALSMNQSIILADEPTSALDNVNRENIISLFREIAHKRFKTVVIVSHDQEVIKYADVHLHIVGKEVKLVFNKNTSNQVESQVLESNNLRSKKHENTSFSLSFIQFMNRKRKKEKRIPQLIILLVSIAVTVTSLGMILSSEFTRLQNNNVADLTDKSLFIVNDTMGLGNQDIEDNLSYSDAEIEMINGIDNIVSISPYYEILGYGLTKENVYDKPDGLSLSIQSLDDSTVFKVNENYAIQPLYSEDRKEHYYLEKLSDYSNEDLTISEDFLLKNRISKEQIIGRRIAIRVYVPTKQFISEIQIRDGSEVITQVYDGNIYKDILMEFRVGAILKSSFPFDRSIFGNAIFIEYDKLMSIIENTIVTLGSSEQTFPNFEEQELKPSALYIVADSYMNIEKISNAAKLISSSITTFSLAQNIVKANEIITLTRTAMTIVSVIFILLSTSILMFVFYLTNNNRKKEVGILKSIGVLKSNILGVYIYELLMHSVTITLMSLILSIVATFLVNNIIAINMSEFIMKSFLNSLILSVLVILISGIFPIMNAANSSPVDTIRNNK